MSQKFDFCNIEVWGTVVSIQIPKDSRFKSQFESSCEEAEFYYRKIDDLFSTFKSDSVVNQLRQNKVSIDTAPAEVKLVWNKCAELRELTMRAFDPWAVPGGFDPSGYVKGWAAQESLRFFNPEIFKHIQINAGGDVVVRGGVDSETPWHIGVQHPDLKGEIAKSYELFDGAVASSGTYERGAHIIDPRVGVPAVGARAATVVGPDAGVADALATALIVDGRDSVNWIGAEEFRNYTFWAADKIGDGAWSFSHP